MTTTLLCRRWTGDSLTLLSDRFGLLHSDSASNLVRKAKSRIDKSKDYRQAVDEIEYNLGWKPKTSLTPSEAPAPSEAPVRKAAIRCPSGIQRSNFLVVECYC